MMINRVCVLLLTAGVLAGPARAQTAPGAPGSNEVVPEKVAPVGGGTLSEKLERSNGVIAPAPSIDPDMAAPPPAAGTTPIIPPPGSPGGPAGPTPK